MNYQISYFDFFNSYFPHTLFVVANFDGSGISLSTILCEEEDLSPLDWKMVKDMNKRGYGVYFTPNSVVAKDGSHALENFEAINACYTDIDIEETKVICGAADMALRNQRKEQIAGEMWMAPIQPSLVVETRNGYQCYWFTNCELEEFKKIQQGIFEHFEHVGADASAKKEVQLMRVPGFLHNKEPFQIIIRKELCSWNSDGSLKYYNSQELAQAFPVRTAAKQVDYPNLKSTEAGMFKHDIFRRVRAMPVLEVMQRINGTVLTGNEVFDFAPGKNGKIKLLKDGRIIPVWIDTEKNMIFSNTEKGFCTIFSFCRWYNLQPREIAAELKKIFP